MSAWFILISELLSWQEATDNIKTESSNILLMYILFKFNWLQDNLDYFQLVFLYYLGMHLLD